MIINDEQNIVVLKNVPSNIVEQAIIVLKPHLKLRKMNSQFDTSYNINSKSLQAEKNQNANYAINEAKIIVSEYIKNLEKDTNNKKEKSIQKKYKKILILTYISTILFLATLILKLF